MLLFVLLSNLLVQFPLNDWFSWAAITYPCTFLVNELTNQLYGEKKARRVVYIGFLSATAISFFLSTWKIAIASGTAFLVSQLLDIVIFSRIRGSRFWWQAPLASSCLASIVDGVLFWTIAFWGEAISIWTLGVGDTLIKLTMDLCMLTPYRLVSRLSLKFKKTA